MIYNSIRFLLGNLRRKIVLARNQAKWRKLNGHNETYPHNIFPLEKVKVGRFTYAGGGLQVYSYRNHDERLEIGDFCSIASDVTFVLGGEHNFHKFTSFPFEEKFMGTICESKSKGPIIIEDDVWIGVHTVILSGVHIGQGAIIGAGSLVLKDVPPYSVFAGNRVIRQRFSDEICKKLTKIDFSKIDKSCIERYHDIINQEVTENNIDEFISVLPLKK